MRVGTRFGTPPKRKNESNWRDRWYVVRLLLQAFWFRGGWGGLVGCVGALWFGEHSLLKFRSSHPKHHYPTRVGLDMCFVFVLSVCWFTNAGDRYKGAGGGRGEVLGGTEGEAHARGYWSTFLVLGQVRVKRRTPRYKRVR